MRIRMGSEEYKKRTRLYMYTVIREVVLDKLGEKQTVLDKLGRQAEVHCEIQ